MIGFTYKDNNLHADNVALATIADAIGTPFYCYSATKITENYKALDDALTGLNTKICFAVKANSNIAVLKTLAKLGAGADTVSMGEIKRAEAASISPNDMVFSGVGKTMQEMQYALSLGIHQINVESIAELDQLNKVAGDMGLTANVALRINPDVDPDTHEKITTGKAENKFGIAWAMVPTLTDHLKSLNHIALKGLAVHIGSQITTLAPFKAAFLRVKDLFKTLKTEGFPVDRIDLGGGLGIYYDESQPAPATLAEYGAMIRAIFEGEDIKLTLEPGRIIVGNAGVLVSKLLYLKQGQGKSFAIMDAAMNDLMRPALYDAHHQMVPLQEIEGSTLTADIVGPVCETGDRFQKNADLINPKSGDLFAFKNAGAYGASLSNTYNSRPLVAEVLVKGHDFAIIRARPTLASLIAQDQSPPWLS